MTNTRWAQTALLAGALMAAHSAQAAVVSLEIIAGSDPLARTTLATLSNSELGCDGSAASASNNCLGGAAPGAVALEESFNWAGGTFDLDSWDVDVEVNPLISAGFSVTNNTAATQWYTMIFSIGISPSITPTSLIGGSAAFTVTDANNDGATISAPGMGPQAMYTALIDGLPVQTLFDAPYSLSALFPGGSNVAVDQFGLPGPSQPGPQALSTIGLRVDFLLSAGDRATFSGNFDVEPVPLPAGVWLFASALVAIRAARAGIAK